MKVFLFLIAILATSSCVMAAAESELQKQEVPQSDSPGDKVGTLVISCLPCWITDCATVLAYLLAEEESSTQLTRTRSIYWNWDWSWYDDRLSRNRLNDCPNYHWLFRNRLPRNRLPRNRLNNRPNQQQHARNRFDERSDESLSNNTRIIHTKYTLPFPIWKRAR